MSVTSIFSRFGKNRVADPAKLGDVLQNFSIEVMPRTAAKVEDFDGLLPQATRIYIAHIEGTTIDDMVATARRLRQDGFAVMPHIPARAVPDRETLELWLRRYREEADVTEALVLAGGLTSPAGAYSDSMQLLESGLFDRYGFTRLHVAGHPEGNRDIDSDGSTRLVDEALMWKQAFSERTDAKMAVVTQFAFDAKPVIKWAERIHEAGVNLPVHFGVAGPAKLQTLIKFAVACGVGPSVSVLQKRARDVTKLVKPYEPTEVLAEVAAYKARNPDGPIEGVHFFPLGGIRASAEWAGGYQTAERRVSAS